MFAVSIAAIFGLVFAKQNPALGISMGLCIGAACGLFAGRAAQDRQSEASPEKPGSRYPVRPLEQDETEAARRLAWKVFKEYESPDYPPEGTEEFSRCLHDGEYLKGIVYYGAFDEDKLVGMLGIREEKNHICFFFVDGEYQRLGIGTGLFRRMLEDFPGQTITLNSSPYGLPFYEAVGFRATTSEQTINGIRFTPMEYRI